MLTVCDCILAASDVGILVGRLDDDHTVISDEAAAAIRFAVAAGSSTDTLDRDLRDAIRHVLLDGPLPPALRALRASLDSGCC
jgi:hypothetical protein